MARISKISQKKKQAKEEEWVEVDTYMIPSQLAEMYIALRQAVIKDAKEWLEANFDQVEVKRLAPQAGEVIWAQQSAGNLCFEFELTPQHISHAQEARDKDQLDKYLKKFIQTN